MKDNDLRVDQSTLTGESNPVRKTSDGVLRDDLSHVEMPNLVFAGTTVSSGTGRAVVCGTGSHTEFGKIANLTQNLKEEPSPLQKEIGNVTKKFRSFPSASARLSLCFLFCSQRAIRPSLLLPLWEWSWRLSRRACCRP